MAEEIQAALLRALGPRGSDLDEAILSYASELILDEPDESEVLLSVVPLLSDAGCGTEEELTEIVKNALENGGAEKSASSYDDEPKKLEKPVLVANNVGGTVAEKMSRLCLTTFAPARVNKLISVWEDGADGEMDEEAFAAKKKLEKKLEKKEKKIIKHERSHAAERDEMLRALTRAPVVIHNSEDVGLAGPCDIHLKNITIDLGGMVLIDDTDITLVHGRRYGLTGRNGSGKTTFMKHLAAHAFEGMPKMQILHIEQEVSGSDLSVLQTVLATDVEREDLLREVREIEALGNAPERAAAAEGAADGNGSDVGARLTAIFERLQEIDADGAVSRAATILSGLGFSPDMQKKPTKEFSGGWRMRVSLAMALFIRPQVLLLDEPTNHLDLGAVVWLEEYLNTWENTLLVVSHAKDFLNEVCTDVILLNDKKLTRWKGNYETFEKRYAESMRQLEKQAESQEKERAHVQQFIDRFRAKAKLASMVQSRIKALERMATVNRAAVDPSIVFHFPNPGAFHGTIAQLSDVSFGYGPDPSPKDFLFTHANMSIDIDTRICLVGPNGAGKSTIGKLLFDEIIPSRGDVRINGKARMAKFSQHHVDQLDLKKSALEFFRAEWPDEPVQKIRSHLGKMGVSGNMALQPISTLSGGQKSRVSFAHITYNPPHFLLLDEPSNHLDLQAVEALIEALSMYEGALLLISHDQHLIEATCNQLWVLDNKKLEKWPSDFPAYKKQLRRSIREAQASTVASIKSLNQK